MLVCSLIFKHAYSADSLTLQYRHLGRCSQQIFVWSGNHHFWVARGNMDLKAAWGPVRIEAQTPGFWIQSFSCLGKYSIWNHGFLLLQFTWMRIEIAKYNGISVQNIRKSLCRSYTYTYIFIYLVNCKLIKKEWKALQPRKEHYQYTIIWTFCSKLNF